VLPTSILNCYAPPGEQGNDSGVRSEMGARGAGHERTHSTQRHRHEQLVGQVVPHRRAMGQVVAHLPGSPFRDALSRTGFFPKTAEHFNYVLVLTARAHAWIASSVLRAPSDPLAPAKEVLARPGPLGPLHAAR